MRFLNGDVAGTSIHASADVSAVSAAAKIQAERLRPAAEDLLRRGGLKMPMAGVRLNPVDVDQALTTARIVDPEARMGAKRMLERAGVY